MHRLRTSTGRESPSTFDHAAAYYSTLLHELTHSTGHRTRLARDGVVNHARFADHLRIPEHGHAAVSSTVASPNRVCTPSPIRFQTVDHHAAFACVRVAAPL